MFKLIVSLTKFLIATTIAVLIASCEMKDITGSGNVTTESRPVTEAFTSVEVSNGLDLVLEQSDKACISVEADDNLQQHIKTTISNGVLIVKCDYNSYRNVSSKKITVQIPNLESLQASSGTSVSSTNALTGKSLMVHSSSGATIAIKVETEKATCEASSGSQITVEGKAIALEAASSSGSGIDAQRLLSNDIKASASSGSHIEVHPLASLNAEASSGGIVNYNNEPKHVSAHASSGGVIGKQ